MGVWVNRGRVFVLAVTVGCLTWIAHELLQVLAHDISHDKGATELLIGALLADIGGIAYVGRALADRGEKKE